MLLLLLLLLCHRQGRHSLILVWSAASMATDECLVCHKCALTRIHTHTQKICFHLTLPLCWTLSTISTVLHNVQIFLCDLFVWHLHLSLDASPIPPPSLPVFLSHFPYLMARFVFLSKYLFPFCSSCLLVSRSCESSALFCTARDWIFIQQTRAVKPQEDSMFKQCHNSSSPSTLARHLTNALLAGPFTGQPLLLAFEKWPWS